MNEDFESQRKRYWESKNADYESRIKAMMALPSVSNSDTHEMSSEGVRLLRQTDERPANGRSCLNSFKRWFCCFSCNCSLNSIAERFEDGNFLLGRIPFRTGIFASNSIPLYIHPFWWFFWVLSFLSGWQASFMNGLFMAIITGPILLITVVIHELGHSAMAVYRGGSVDKILIWPLGGLAFINSSTYDEEPISNAMVAVAGPLTHIPQVLVWGLLMYAVSWGTMSLNWPLGWSCYDFLMSICAAAIAMQIALFCFNLLPAYPLDGGKILSALLSYIGWQKVNVMRTTSLVGGFIGSYLFFSALSSLFITDPSSSGLPLVPVNLGGDSTLLLISIFIMSHCNALWVRATQEEFLVAAQQHQRAHPSAGGDHARRSAPASSATYPQQYGSVASLDRSATISSSSSSSSSNHHSKQPPASLPKAINKSPEKKIFTLNDV